MTSPDELVRARDERTGHHITIPRRLVTRDPKRYHVLENSKAVDVNGRPVPPKPNTKPKPVAPKEAK